MKPIKLVKNRSDIGAGTRGSDMGIDAIEIAAIKAEDDYFNRYPFVDVTTRNETIYNKFNTLSAKRITYVEDHCKRVCSTVKETLQEGFFPIVLSGDHSSALGTISGIKDFYKDKEIGVIWIDAHGDLHSPYTSPSGNVHGMPLAAAIGFDNLDYQLNAIENTTKIEWESMKNIGSKSPKIYPHNLVFFGVRDTEPAEDAVIKKFSIRNYPVHEVRHRSIKTCSDEVLKKLEHCDLIYISFDVDSMDCDLISRGTGTPVSFGFSPNEIVEIVHNIIATKKVVCLEVAEVNPLLDFKGNKMAETAFDILQKITQKLESL